MDRKFRQHDDQVRLLADVVRPSDVAAAWLCCRIDMREVRSLDARERHKALHRISRAIERERLRGTGGTPGYDLERHMALKRCRDRLATTD